MKRTNKLKYEMWQEFYAEYYAKTKGHLSIEEKPMAFIYWMRKNYFPPLNPSIWENGHLMGGDVMDFKSKPINRKDKK